MTCTMPAGMKLASHEEAFTEAIAAIVTGARALRATLDPITEQAQPCIDPEEPFVKTSAGAYCLTLAYRVWQNTKPGPLLPLPPLFGDGMMHAMPNAQDLQARHEMETKLKPMQCPG